MLPLSQSVRRQRPQLTAKILLYALCDVAGMILLASGALWLARGQALFVADFPSSSAEAIALTVIGLALMLWAAGRILRELLKRPADTARESD
jgi:membrane protein implicated in regulation of membrane protease activity